MEPDPAERVHYLMSARHSSRAPFDPKWHVAPRELAHLVEAARWAPSPHNMQNFQLVIVESPAVLAELGAIEVPVSPAFLAESAPHVAASIEELERRQAGILGTSLGPPQPRRLAELIAGAPMLIVVLFDPTQRAPASEHDMLGMMGLGCMLENMWLVAQVLRLDFQILSSVAQGAVASEVERVLAIPPPWQIAFGLRIGHAIVPVSAPRIRRDVQRFVHRDHFAK